MKLLLTSGGFTNTIEKIFLNLLQKPAELNSVGFITTAANGEENNATWDRIIWLEEYRNQLRKLKISNIEDIGLENKTEKELEDILLQKDILFVNGGNTFYLMYWAERCGFGKIVNKFLQKGGVYVGVSAGSIITCPTIESASWYPGDINKVNLENLKGLGIVLFLIHPHFEEAQKDIIEDQANQIKFPVVALTDEQAVFIDDEKLQVIGKGNKHFFNGFEEK
ncbi:hypothetical protein C4559_01825 [Candidatus Microgenomates bacterium]|nr:MAG: hypothetical protein C4559_01825 [Candidatus Microgenomates bacterium]